ncbi:MAG: 3-oxoacyl-ACP reductase, partial [Myxococcales bacterium]|nr:3-oxoacyl-ACP reductase [Myxococcales bacterium]
IEHTDQLIELYGFFHEWVGRIRSHGRALVLARACDAGDSPMQFAVVAALSGFVRSLAKEIGRKGATAHLIQVDNGAERNAEAVVRFLASRRSAFLTGQIWHVTPASLVPQRYVRELEGKITLVTGAARGIGEAIAHRLAQEGAAVVALDRPEARDDAARVADQLGGYPLIADLADPNAGTQIAAELKQRFGRVDVVVHNAGIIRDRTLGKMNEDVWKIVMNVNLAAIDRLHTALEPMIPDGGRIVALSSVAGIAGNFGQTNYAASKSGLIGYLTAQARRLAERGITANIVAPGFIDTALTRTIPLANREAARRMSALGQGGLPEDIANLITFLSSPSAAGLNGQVLRACGGMFIGA